MAVSAKNGLTLHELTVWMKHGAFELDYRCLVGILFREFKSKLEGSCTAQDALQAEKVHECMFNKPKSQEACLRPKV